MDCIVYGVFELSPNGIGCVILTTDKFIADMECIALNERHNESTFKVREANISCLLCAHAKGFDWR